MRGYLAAMSRTTKALYLPLSIGAGVAGGMLAGGLFKQVWKRVGDGNQPPPNPKDLNRSATAVLAAAALQGLIFGLVRAAVDRAGAKGYQAVTDEALV